MKFTIVLVFCNLFTFIQGESVTKYGWTSNACIIGTYNAISLENCKSECESRVQCESVTYIRLIQICHLHREVTSLENNYTIVREPGSFYITVPGNPEALICGSAVCSESQTCNRTANPPVCTFTECPVLETSLTIISHGKTQQRVGSKLRFSCLNGSEYNGVPGVAICKEDGQWELSNISCKPDFELKKYGMVPFGMSTLPVQMTLNDCIIECIHQHNCYAIGYNKESQTCGYSSFQFAYVSESGWLTVNKLWPVWHSGGPSSPGARYLLTFDEANDFCVSQNTTMASINDVIEAFDQGLSACLCCWVSEGFATVSMNFEHPNCNNIVGVPEDFCRWGSTWNVYCKNTDYREGPSIWT